MAQTFFPITPVDVTPASTGAWVDVDISAYVPSGITGAILHLTMTINAYAIGLRKNGSTDNRTSAMWYPRHAWAAIGVDANRIFEAYIGNLTNQDIWLVGYTMSGVTFFTNAYNKSLGSTGVWTDIDSSAVAPSAGGLIFEIDETSGIDNTFGFRKNGSTDNRQYKTSRHNCWGLIIGCDAGQIAEGIIANLNIDFYLVGYITDGVTFNLNATNLSLAGIGAWTDLSALPASSVMGFIEVVDTNATTGHSYGLRQNGSSEDIYYPVWWHTWGFVACDISRLIEGKIADTAVDFWLVGYATAGQSYTRSGTALLGLLGIGTRTVARSRTGTSLLGLKGIGSRSATLSRTGISLLGLKGIGSRVIALTRSGTALLGLKGIGLRVVALTRSGTSLLGLKGIGIWGKSYIRTGIALLGLLTTGSRTVARNRTGTALLGLKGIASRSIAISRSGVSVLGLKGIGSRVLALSRTGTALLGLKGIGEKTKGYVRSGIALLGLKATGSRTISLSRIGTGRLGLKGIGSRAISLSRSGVALLGLKGIGTWVKEAIALIFGHRVTAYHRIDTEVKAYHQIDSQIKSCHNITTGVKK
jgi:hypothetical protein